MLFNLQHLQIIRSEICSFIIRIIAFVCQRVTNIIIITIQAPLNSYSNSKSLLNTLKACALCNLNLRHFKRLFQSAMDCDLVEKLYPTQTRHSNESAINFDCNSTQFCNEFAMLFVL